MGGRQTESMRVGARQTESMRVGARQTESMRVGARQTESMRVGARQTESMRVGARQTESMRVGARQTESMRVHRASLTSYMQCGFSRLVVQILHMHGEKNSEFGNGLAVGTERSAIHMQQRFQHMRL